LEICHLLSNLKELTNRRGYSPKDKKANLVIVYKVENSLSLDFGG